MDYHCNHRSVNMRMCTRIVNRSRTQSLVDLILAPYDRTIADVKVYSTCRKDGNGFHVGLKCPHSYAKGWQQSETHIATTERHWEVGLVIRPAKPAEDRQWLLFPFIGQPHHPNEGSRYRQQKAGERNDELQEQASTIAVSAKDSRYPNKCVASSVVPNQQVPVEKLCLTGREDALVQKEHDRK